MSYKQTVCSKCGRAIKWLKTPAGKWMPADAGPIAFRANPEGRELLVDDKGRMIRCDTSFEGPGDGYGRRPHWGTCPNADEFRRKKEAAYGHERAE